MGLSCSVPEIMPRPANLRCGAEGYLSAVTPALITSQNETQNYIQCANLCGSQAGRCKAFSYSAATTICNLYSKSIMSQGFKKQAGTGNKFWNRGCFGTCTCPPHSLWDGNECQCQAPYTEDNYGNVCRCPYVGATVNATTNQCQCPANQVPIAVNETVVFPQDPTRTGGTVQACGCPTNAPMGSDKACHCPGDTKLSTYYPFPCVCPTFTQLRQGTTGTCDCTITDGTKQADGSCGCAAPRVISVDQKSCVCPGNQQYYDGTSNTCINCPVDGQFVGTDGACHCPEGTVITNGACTACGNGASVVDGECSCPQYADMDSDGNCNCPAPLELRRDANGDLICGCQTDDQTYDSISNTCNCPYSKNFDGTECSCPQDSMEQGEQGCICNAPEELAVDGNGMFYCDLPDSGGS